MFLRIEKGSAVPISRQIARQIGALCAAGSLSPGDRLPSVRELARQLGVNLEMRQGQGTFVAARAKANASPGQRARLIEELRQLARQGLSLGLSPEQFHDLVSIALDELQTQAAVNHAESAS
jgi:GntR family transcriptional regulator